MGGVGEGGERWRVEGKDSRRERRIERGRKGLREKEGIREGEYEEVPGRER